MSFIGKKITDVIPGLTNAKVLKSREYEVKANFPHGPGTGTMVRTQDLDIDGDGKADVRLERNIDIKTGLYSDTFELANSPLVKHDFVRLSTDRDGVVRHQYHRDVLPDGNYGRQVNLKDSNGDGKVESKAVRLADGTFTEIDDSDRDGTADREYTVDANGKSSVRSVVVDSFFLDED